MNAARQSVVDKVSAQQASGKLLLNDKRKIIEHYDTVSPYYRSLWGEHLHHGIGFVAMNQRKERSFSLSSMSLRWPT